MVGDKHNHRKDAECQICKNKIPFEIPEEIIEAIGKEDLVIFAGSGISSENKMVFPWSFYEDIHSELQLDDNDKPSFSKLMLKYCEQKNGRRKLLNKIKERLDYIENFPELYLRASEFHKEISTIHNVKEIITTNWDDLFERECGANPIVIPEDFIFWQNPGRKVLKIHGSINNYGSIVATEEDYQQCHEKLRDSILGSYLKTLLATKTVLFVGYSFGDEDFNKIYNFLKSEMKGLSPHSFLVTLDKEAKKKFDSSEITVIRTDATFFVEEIKKYLVKNEQMISDNHFLSIPEALNFLNSVHIQLTESFSVSDFPSIIYTASYQDGLKHALERFLSRFKTGEYSKKENIGCMICHYNDTIEEKRKDKLFHDVAYFIGYRNGLIFLLEGERAKDLPVYYILETDKICSNLKEYTNLIKSKKEDNEYSTYLKNLIERKGLGGKLVLHHTPFG